MKTKKVITAARLRTAEPTALLNSNHKNRSILIGKRSGDSESAAGLIGKIAEQGTASTLLDFGVWLDLSFPHVAGIFGTRGSGKSFDLGVLVECVAGLKSVVNTTPPRATVIFFDIQDQFWTLALEPNAKLPEDQAHIAQLSEWGLNPGAIQNLRVWCPAGFKTSLPGAKSLTLDPAQLTGDDWLALLELDRYSPMGQALLVLIDNHGPALPAELAARAVPSAGLAAFQQGTLDGLRWRLQSISDSELLAANGTKLQELLEPNTVSILLLRQLSDSLRALVVSVVARLSGSLMGAYHQRRRVARRTGVEQSQEILPERLWLFLDEAHVIVPAGQASAATGPIIDYVKRGRDAGLSLVFATQQPSAVDSRLMSQVDFTFTHALGFENDLQAAVARMPTRSTLVYELSSWKLNSMNDVLRSLEPGECVVADAASGRAFVARIRPRLTAHGGNTPA